MKDIPLRNGKSAKFVRSKDVIVKDVDPINPVSVHIYNAPCPVCNFENTVHSYDGYTFITFQLTCKYCGVYYRPAVEPSHLANMTADDIFLNQAQKKKFEREKQVYEKKMEKQNKAVMRALEREQKSKSTMWSGPSEDEDTWK